MSTSPRVRKSAVPQASKFVKASLSVDVDLHARWSAAAALRRMDRNAFAVEALTTALKGIHIIDRRKSPASVDTSDRLAPASGLSDDDES